MIRCPKQPRTARQITHIAPDMERFIELRVTYAMLTKLPNNPLDFIQRCVRHGKVLWTYHVNMRMRDRFISRRLILDSHPDYEIIEEYPEDRYLPSYLVYSEYSGDIFHILFAADVEGDNVRIVTAYRPSPEEWGEDFKTRRRSR
jgi:hypothetical protein